MPDITREINGFRVIYTPGEEEKMRIYERTFDDFGYPYYARRWDTLHPESILYREMLIRLLKGE